MALLDKGYLTVKACTHDTSIIYFMEAWGVTVYRIDLPFARGCRVGV